MNKKREQLKPKSKVELDVEIAKDLSKFCHDPLGFVHYAFPWGEPGTALEHHRIQEWQKETMGEIKKQLAENKFKPIRIARASGRGVGKSCLVAWLILWAMSTCKNCRGVVTANTAPQLATTTWPELSVWLDRAIHKHWWNLTSTTLNYSLSKGYDRTWRTDAVTWSSNNIEAFQGLHAQGSRILLIMDEASAIDDAVWEAAEGFLSDKDTEILWLVFGNPTRNTGRFRECFRRHKSLWNTANIDSRTVEITNKALYKEWAEAYGGEDSDFMRIHVRGEFPNQATGQLIPIDVVQAAMKRDYGFANIQQMISKKPKILGIDMARMGEDSSTVWLRQGVFCRRLLKERKITSDVLQDRIAAILEREKPDHVFMDMGNIGAAVYDNLKRWGHRNITGIDFGGSPTDNRVYANKRIEMWDKMREWLEKGGQLPSTGAEALDIENDLIAPEFFYNSKGLKLLESKRDMERRGISSPDDGDALCLTFAAQIRIGTDVERFAARPLNSGAVPTANSAWDPFKINDWWR